MSWELEDATERLLERLAVFFADELGDVAQDYLTALDEERVERSEA